MSRTRTSRWWATAALAVMVTGQAIAGPATASAASPSASPPSVTRTAARPSTATRTSDAPTAKAGASASQGVFGATRATLTAAQSELGPGVAFDTMATSPSGAVGVRIGQRFYPAPAKAGPQWQVLVVNAHDLSLISNKTYSISESTKSGGKSPLLSDLKNLVGHANPTSQRRVFVVNHPGWSSVQDLSTFAVLGYAPSAAAGFPGTSTPGGGFSLIAALCSSNYTDTTSAINRPSAQYRLSDEKGGGAMRAVLVLDRFGNYRYVPNDRAVADTRAGEGCDPRGTNCTLRVRVGPDVANDTVYSLTGGAGFLIGLYDKLTLKHVDTEVFATNGPRSDAEARAMTTYLTGLRKTNPGDLVIVSSIRNPGSTGVAGHNIIVDPAVRYDTMSDLAQAIADIGGTRDAFNRAASQVGLDYSVLGWVDKGLDGKLVREGTAPERSGAGSQARLGVRLQPGPDSLFRPGLVNGGGIQLDGLQELALADPSGQAWPALDPRVYQYLQDATGHQLPSGIQQRYWSNDPGIWSTIYAAVVAVHFEDGHGFDSATFDQTRGELLAELRTVMGVRSRMDMYKQVYADAKWGDLTTTSLVRDTLAHENQENVQFSLAKMFVSLLRLAVPFAGELEESVSAALELAATSLETAEWTGAFEAADPRPSYVDISLAASQLGVKLNEATDETAAVYDRYGELLLSDPVKFATVRTWTCDDGSTSPRSWCDILSTEFQTTLRATIARANERLVWTTLSPMVYAVYDLGVSPHTDLSEYACGTLSSRVTGGVFGDLDPEIRDLSAVWLMRNTGKLPRMDSSAKVGQPWNRTPEYHIFVMGMPVSGTPWHTFPSSGGRNWPKEVEGEVLHRLFDPVAADDDDPRMGGLGIDKREFIPALRDHNSLNGWDWCGFRGSSE